MNFVQILHEFCTFNTRTLPLCDFYNILKFAVSSDQVNFLVYGPERPYFKQKQKNNITKFWPIVFF